MADVLHFVWEPIPHDFSHPLLSNLELEEIRQIAAKFIQRQIPNTDFNFDSTELSKHELYAISIGMFLTFSTHELLQISWIDLLNFIIDVERGYKENPYHSFKHAVDVTFVLFYVLYVNDACRFFTHLDIIILLTSAICHDISHPGLNNLYQVNGKTDLAILYGDTSVLEKFSISHTLSLLRKHSLLKNLSPNDRKFFTHSVEQAILGTDMVCHFDLMNEFNNMISTFTSSAASPSTTLSKLDESSSQVASVTIQLPLIAKNRQILMKALLHGADISNPCRPWEMCKKWSDMVVQEFFLQGDVEKNVGLPISPNMDRESSNQFEISLGFGDFIVKPYFEMICNFMPETKEFVTTLESNRVKWLDLKATTPVEVLERSKKSPITDHLLTAVDGYSSDGENSETASYVDSIRQIRANIMGRRLSVAAGVITIPQNLPSPLKVSRKISFEYVDQSGHNSANSSVRHSTVTLHSNMRVRYGEPRVGDSKSSLVNDVLKQQMGSLHFDSSTNDSTPSTEISRRASGFSDDESGLLRFVIRRRNSHVSSSSAQQLPHSESFTRTKGQETISSAALLKEKRPVHSSRDNSTEIISNPELSIKKRQGMFSSEGLSLSLIATPHTALTKTTRQSQSFTAPEHIINPKRLSRPQSYLCKMLSEDRLNSVKKMMLRSRIENMLIPRDLPNKEMILDHFAPMNMPDGKYRTIHRSDKIYEYLRGCSRKKILVPIATLLAKDSSHVAQQFESESKSNNNQLEDNSVHFVHAGEVQVRTNSFSARKVIRRSTTGTSAITTTPESSSASFLNLFDSVSNGRSAITAGRLRARSDANVINHRRAFSEGIVIPPSILAKVDEQQNHQQIPSSKIHSPPTPAE